MRGAGGTRARRAAIKPLYEDQRLLTCGRFVNIPIHRNANNGQGCVSVTMLLISPVKVSILQVLNVNKDKLVIRNILSLNRVQSQP